MVEVSTDERNIDNLDEDYFKNYNVICACHCSKTQIERINAICRKFNILFFAGDVFGMYGYSFTDLNDHKYVE